MAEPSGQVYHCRFCGQAFDRPTALGGHMNCHKEGQALVTCFSFCSFYHDPISFYAPAILRFLRFTCLLHNSAALSINVLLTVYSHVC